MNLFFSIKYFIEDFFFKAKRACEFFVLGWNDYDYDYVYFYRILHFKLKKMSDFFNSEDAVASGENRNESIKKCVDLIEKLQSNNYEKNYIKFEKKWGPPGHYVSKDGYLRSEREDALTSTKAKIMRKEFFKALELDEKEKKKDMNVLFDTIKNNHCYWWD